MVKEVKSSWNTLLEGGNEIEGTEYVTISVGRDIFDTLNMLKFFTLNSDKRKTWNRYFDKVIPILMKECDPQIFELALNLAKTNPNMKLEPPYSNRSATE